MNRAWRRLSERERGLILGALGLALLVLLTELAVRPLLDSRAEAVRGHEAARALVEEIAAKASRLARLRADGTGTAGPSPGTLPLRLVVGRTAQARGIAIARLTPQADGALGLWLEGIDTATLFAWLVELRERHHIDVREADIGPGEDGIGLRVRLQLAGGGGT